MFICGKCGYEEEHKNNIPTFLSPRNSTYGSATNSHNFSPPRNLHDAKAFAWCNVFPSSFSRETVEGGRRIINALNLTKTPAHAHAALSQHFSPEFRKIRNKISFHIAFEEDHPCMAPPNSFRHSPQKPKSQPAPF